MELAGEKIILTINMEIFSIILTNKELSKFITILNQFKRSIIKRMNKLELFVHSKILVYINTTTRLYINGEYSIVKTILESEVVIVSDVSYILMIDYMKEALLIDINIIIIRSNHIDENLGKYVK